MSTDGLNEVDLPNIGDITSVYGHRGITTSL